MSKKTKNILTAIIFYAVYIAIWKLLPKFSDFQFLNFLIGYIIMTFILLGMLWYTKKLDILKFDSKKFFKGLKTGRGLIIIAIILLAAGITKNLNDGNAFVPIIKIICFVVAICLGTGFCEETLYRGVIQNLMYDTFERKTRKGVMLSVIITALMFGAMHLGNFTDTGWSSVAQFFSTIGMGLVLGAIYARCKSMWSVIFIHGFWDMCLMTDSGLFGIGKALEGANNSKELATQFTSGIFVLIVMILVFLFLLRKKKENEYIEK